MDIWYTPERIALQKEIGERRLARYERRAARVARQERQERVFRAFKTVLGYLFGTALFMAYLFFGALWASI
jgi:hypothetical protein